MSIRFHDKPILWLSLAAFTVATLVGISAPEAQAQIQAKKAGETVRTRPNSDLDPLGVRSGSILIFPTLAVEGRYQDNLFSEDIDVSDDLVLIVRPNLEMRSMWSRHELLLFAEGEFGFHDKFSTEDFERYVFQGQGTVDISRDTNFIVYGAFRREYEMRSDPDALSNARSPIEYDQIDGAFQLNHRFNRTTVMVGANVRRLEYDDVFSVAGNLLNQQDRNRTQYGLESRVDYEFQKNVGVFVEFNYNWRDYDDLLDDRGFNRSSEGYDVHLGVDLRFTSVIFGHVYAGYSRQNYDDPRFNIVDGVTMGVDLDWNVTPLTTVHLGVSRRLRDTVEDMSPGFYNDRINLRVDHELQRTLIVSAMGSLGRYKYQQINRNDKVWSIGAQVEWKINRNLRMNLRYMHWVRETDYAGVRDYVRNSVTLGIEAAY